MMGVDVEVGTSFKANTPRVLFETPLSESTPGDPGRRLDANNRVLNYAQALKR